MVRMPELAKRRRPPFHEAQPILYTPEAEAAAERVGRPVPASALDRATSARLKGLEGGAV
jgi:hypothetical protein